MKEPNGLVLRSAHNINPLWESEHVEISFYLFIYRLQQTLSGTRTLRGPLPAKTAWEGTSSVQGKRYSIDDGLPMPDYRPSWSVQDFFRMAQKRIRDDVHKWQKKEGAPRSMGKRKGANPERISD
jgi:hypothetical protein